MKGGGKRKGVSISHVLVLLLTITVIYLVNVCYLPSRSLGAVKKVELTASKCPESVPNGIHSSNVPTTTTSVVAEDHLGVDHDLDKQQENHHHHAEEQQQQEHFMSAQEAGAEHAADKGGRKYVRELPMTEKDDSVWTINSLRKHLARTRIMLAETRGVLEKERAESARDRRKEMLMIAPAPPAGRKFPCYAMELAAAAPTRSMCDSNKGTISGSSVYVFKDVCFDSQGTPHFPSEQQMDRATSKVQFDIAGVKVGGTLYSRVPKGMDVETAAGKDYVLPHDGGYEWINSTVLLYASKFPSHVTHVLEGAGNINLATTRNKPREKDCHPDDMTCFPEVSHFVFMNGNVASNGWHESVLRVMAGDAEKKVKFSRPNKMSGKYTRQMACFEKAIAPSFYYSVWPETESTEGFQKTLQSYMIKNHNVDMSKLYSERRILLSKRATKRVIVDWDIFSDFVKKVASEYSTPSHPITVTQIEFGKHPFQEQAAAASADLIMGIHGADLTNMLFQQKGSVLLEVNPLFFFENRFFEIAAALGNHYMAWTCTNEDCAFGGDSNRFRGFMKGKPYDVEKREWRNKDGTTFRWPFDRYVGYACPECDRQTCCGELAGGYWGLRETSVKVGKNLDQLRAVIERAFAVLGWKRP